ncbi:MAG: type II secretion system F family protein [Gammaproteobacteria bacterium]|nr:type II secretion system F family protein [Gammaproteobacteria bacterium]
MAVTKEDVIFQWEGTDKRGVRLKGEKTGRDQSFIRAELRRQGITPQRVRRKPKSFKLGERVKAKDISIFSRQIATMLNAGVPLVQALDIISTASENEKFQKLITRIKTDVESGSNFADTLRQHPVHFDELYCNLVEAGEEAGVLDTVLETIATYKERIEEIKGKVNKAMYYPTAVVAVAVGVSALLLIKVIPQFESIFQGFGAELPAFTQLIVSLSNSLVEFGYLYFLGIIGIVVGAVMAKKRSPRFQHFLDRSSLKIPVVGGILRKAALARFARTLGITFAAGVPLVEALRTVSGATGNEVYREAVLRVREDVAAGHQLQLAMQQTNVFPSMVVQMTAIGEEAGSLDQMLKKVAEFYEEEVNNAVDALSSLLEPVIILIVGGLIGSMVIAMYLPIFKMAAVV